MAVNAKTLARGAFLPVTLIVLWEVLSHADILPMDTMSRPSHIVVAGYNGFADGSILKSTWQTLEAALFGFAIATIAGVLLGVILGLSKRLEAIVTPTVDALRPIPSVALIPLSLLLFGFGLNLEAAVVAFACFWPILLVTIAAVHGIEPRLLEVARALEMPFGARLRKIILPAALGRISVGLRVAIGISLVVAVTVEIVVNPRGLGYSMILSQQTLKSDLMYAQLLWLGAVGWTLNYVVQRGLRLWPGANEAGGFS